jgi:exonuclease SbcC
MKLLAFSIENLASISSPVTIDLQTEPLASAGIFAITGKTGSGKSTLLDAICLALYATTPRYERYSLKKGIEQMLHKGAAKGYARVVFQSVQGEIYEAEWRITKKRTRKGSTEEPDVKTERSLRRVTDDTVISTSVSEMKTLLPQLLGLNYEQFTRSVMLAQGEFTSFLKADAGTKAMLLEKLTGTDLYGRVSVEVHERSVFEGARLRELLLQKGNIEILGEEERETLSEQAAQLEREMHRLREEERETERQLVLYAAYRQLETGVAEAREKNASAQAEAAAAQSRAQQLALIEAAMPMREPLRAAGESAENLEALQLHLEQLEKEEAERSEQAEEAALMVRESRAAVETIALEEAQLQPQIAEARRQDNNLALLGERTKTAGDAAEKALLVATQLRNDLQKRRSVIAAQQAAEKEILQWLEQKAPYRELLQNKALVQQLLRDKGTLEKMVTDSAQAVIQATAAAAESAEKVKRGTPLLAAAEDLLNTHLSLLKSLGVSASRAEILAGTHASALETSQHFWKEQSQRWLAFEATAQQLQRQEQQLSAQEKTVVEARERGSKQLLEKERAAVQRLESTQRLATLKRAHSHTVAELRHNLCDGEACPVCGSKAHPAAQIALPAIDTLLLQYEAEAQEATRRFEEALRAEATAQSETSAAEKEVLQLRRETEKASTLLAHQLATWKQAATAEEFQNPEEVRRAFYESRQDQLEAQRKAYTDAQRSASAWKLAAVAQENAVERHQAAIAKTVEITQEWNRRKLLLAENTVALKRFFTTPNWEKRWQENPIDFAAGVERLSEEWEQKGNALSRLQIGLGNAAEILQSDAQKLAAAEGELEGASLLFEEAKRNLEGAKAHRQELLAGLPAETVEAQLAEKRTAAAIQSGIAERIAEQLATGLRDLLRDRQQTRRQQGEMQQKEAAALAQVADWLSAQKGEANQQVSRAYLEELLRTTPAEMNATRVALAAIKEAAQQGNILLQEREAQLQIAGQKLSATPEAELHSAVQLLQERLGDAGIQKAQVLLRLAKDDNGRAQLGDLLHRIETQGHTAGRWQKLRELIGSADGKAFRAIAQEYTLDILLLEANLQLAQLAPRYRLLRATGTLDLQIVDRDMGNEVRTVHSISGGESFLVSLSLALGLAALSAGKQLVECLFIDEGFGMLDPATLHLALDALEMLQQQGRKIGVISHIKEMTDRIPVQIQVRKKSNGRSAVEVVRLLE